MSKRIQIFLMFFLSLSLILLYKPLIYFSFFYNNINSIMKTNSEFLKSFSPVGKTDKNIQCPIDSGSMSVQMTGTCCHNNLHKSDLIPINSEFVFIIE